MRPSGPLWTGYALSRPDRVLSVRAVRRRPDNAWKETLRQLQPERYGLSISERSLFPLLSEGNPGGVAWVDSWRSRRTGYARTGFRAQPLACGIPSNASSRKFPLRTGQLQLSGGPGYCLTRGHFGTGGAGLAGCVNQLSWVVRGLPLKGETLEGTAWGEKLGKRV